MDIHATQGNAGSEGNVSDKRLRAVHFCHIGSEERALKLIRLGWLKFAKVSGAGDWK